MIESTNTCYIHPKNSANTTCERCEKPICASDHRSVSTYGKGPVPVVIKKRVCPSCKEIIASKQKRRKRTSYIVITIVTLVSILLITSPIWLFSQF